MCYWTICDLVKKKKLALPSQSRRRKPQTNHALVTHVFPRFSQFTRFHFDLSLAPCDNLFSLIGRLLAEYFGFGFTRLPWKVLRVASKKHLRLYQNVEKVTVSSELFVIHWSKRWMKYHFMDQRNKREAIFGVVRIISDWNVTKNKCKDMLWLCHLVTSFLWGDEIWFWFSKLLNIYRYFWTSKKPYPSQKHFVLQGK